jgi:hypothetical protein
MEEPNHCEFSLGAFSAQIAPQYPKADPHSLLQLTRKTAVNTLRGAEKTMLIFFVP